VKNIPKILAELDLETGKRVLKLVDMMDANEDVQNVYTTANFTEEMLAE